MGLKDLTLSKRQSNINKWISNNSKKAYNNLTYEQQRRVEIGENTFVSKIDQYKNTPKGKLRSYLETTSREKLLEKKANEAEHQNKTMGQAPMNIFIG